MKSILSVLAILIFTLPVNAQSVDKLQTLTNLFLESLDQEELAIAKQDYDSERREVWTNLPVGLEKRPGIRFGDLAEESMIKVHHILIELLSSQGYLKTTSIMKLDDVLNERYQLAFDRKIINEGTLNMIKGLDWDYGNYYVTIWGTPDAKEPWGLKFGGHHLSINFSVVGDELSVTPFFLGTDPGEVEITKFAGLRVLSKEEDYGFMLINSLNEAQKSVATISRAVPGDIITNPSYKGEELAKEGIRASELDETQTELLQILIGEYIDNLEHQKAHYYHDKIEKSGLENVYFSWIGSYEAHRPHYYMINGPDFIIEYDNVGFQNDGNHVHCVLREKGNDFGADILKKHYEEHKH